MSGILTATKRRAPSVPARRSYKPLLLTISDIAVEGLANTGSLLDKQDPGLVIRVGESFAATTDRVQDGGTSCKFPESYSDIPISIEDVQNGYEIEVEAHNMDKNNSSKRLLGKGRVKIVDAIPNHNENWTFTIELSKGIVMMKGILVPSKPPAKLVEPVTLTIDSISCTGLLDAGSFMDKQDPGLVIRIGDQYEFVTDRVQDGGVSTSFPEKYTDIDISYVDIQNGLSITIDAHNLDKNNKSKRLLGTGAVKLIDVLPRPNERATFDVPLDKGTVTMSGIIIKHEPLVPRLVETKKATGATDETVKKPKALTQTADERRELAKAQALAQRSREHYLESCRLIKRSFGDRIEEDLQLYNWGLTLTMEMGTNDDKLQFLLSVYSKSMPKRVTQRDFDIIMHDHTSLRHLPTRLRETKWLELMASFKIHMVKKEGYQDSIGKKNFAAILDVCNVTFDLDLDKVTREMRRIDKYGNRVHMLLLHDPLISGKFHQERQVPDAKAKRDFEKQLATEESKYANIALEKLEEELKTIYEENKKLEEEKARRKAAREHERYLLKKAEEDAKLAAIARMEDIIRGREAAEAKRAEEARVRDEQLRVERIDREKREKFERELEVFRLKQEAEKRRLEELAAAAQPDDSDDDDDENFDHLEGEERLKAEAAARLRAHRRAKRAEKEKQREDTARLFAESRPKLYDEDFRRRAWAAPGEDEYVPAISPRSALLKQEEGGSTKRQAIEGARILDAVTMPLKKKQVDFDSVRKVISRTADSSDILNKFQRKGQSKKERASPSRSVSPSKPDAAAADSDKKKDEAFQKREEEKRKVVDESEKQRIEFNREKRRKEELERQQQMERIERQKEAALLEVVEKKRLEEELRVARKEAEMKRKHDREIQLAEMRRLEEEQRKATETQSKSKQQSSQTSKGLKGGHGHSDGDDDAKIRKGRKEASKKSKEDKKKSAATAVEPKVAVKEIISKASSLMDSLMLSVSETSKRKKSTTKKKKSGKGNTDGEREQSKDNNNEDDDISRVESLVDGTLTHEDDKDESEQESEDESEQESGDESEQERLERERLEEEERLEQERLEEEERLEQEKLEEEERLEQERLEEEKRLEQERLEEEERLEQERLEEEERLEQERLEEEKRLEQERLEEEKRLEQERLEEEKRLEQERLEEEEKLKQARLKEEERVEQEKLEEEERLEKERLEEEERLEQERLKEEERLEQERLEEEERLEQERLKEEERLEQERLEEEERLEQERLKEEERRREAERIEEQQVQEMLKEAERKEKQKQEELAKEEKRSREEEEEEEEERKKEVDEQTRIEAQRLSFEERQRERERLEKQELLSEQVRLEQERLEREQELVESSSLTDNRGDDDVETTVDTTVENTTVDTTVNRPREETKAVEKGTSNESSSTLLDEESTRREGTQEDLTEVKEEDQTAADSSSSSSPPPLPNDQYNDVPDIIPTSLKELQSRRAEDLEFDVPKTDGGLKIFIRHDEEDGTKGLFVHGFKPGCNAEQQGLVKVGDEVLAINDISVQGLYLEDVVSAMQTDEESDTVRFKIRRFFSPRAVPAKSAMASTPLRINQYKDTDTILSYNAPHVMLEANVARPDHLPSLEKLFGIQGEDLEFEIPKTDGELKMYIRHDDEGDRHGLFLHGFKPNSNAERQGLIQVGDEIIAINDSDVKGKFLEDVIAALQIDSGRESVKMKVHRRSLEYSPRLLANVQAQVPSIRSPIDRLRSDEHVLTATPPHVILDNIPRPDHLPSLEKLFGIQGEDLEFEIPKTDGELKMYIRHDDEGDRHGLFLHGFKPNSNAERQGLIQVGDEIIEIDDIVVKGKFLETVIDILKYHEDDTVKIKVHRRVPDADDAYQVKSARAPLTSRTSERITAAAAEVNQKALSDSNVFEFDVPKTDGELKMYIRHDDIGEISGLFIHGSKPGSNASEQGSLEPNDEVIALDGISVKGQYLGDIVSILEQHKENSIKIKVYRHPLLLEEALANDTIEKVNTTDSMETSIKDTNLSIITPRYEGASIKYSRKKKVEEDMPRIGLPYLKANEKDVIVSKTGGQLKIHIRSDGNDDNKGLFVHGFMPNSNAAKEGQILIGDELIALDGYWVKGQRLEYVAKILKRHKSQTITMRIKRV